MSTPSNLHTQVRVLWPSFLSGWVTVVSSLMAVLFLLSPRLYKGSDFARYFDSIDLRNNSFYENYQHVSQVVNTSNFAADVSVFVVWMVIGLLAYSIVLSAIRLVASVVHFIQDEEYFKEDRERIAHDALIRLVVRTVAAAGLYGLFVVSMPFVVSYIFIFANAALTGSWLEGAWYALLMTLVVAACIHIAVVLLRMVLLRVRVFFDR